MNSFIHMRGVRVDLRKVTILRNVNLTIEPSEFWGIAGPNGSGKTTMIRILAGFVLPSQGEVCVLGKPLEDWKLTTLRKRVGYLPQHLSFDEGVPISAMEVVLMGRTGKRGMLRILTGKDYEIARSCAAELGITALLERPVGSLSDGERQLVQLARALAQEPEILILDEPTSNLDPRAAAGFMDIVEHLHAQRGLTVINVTHEIESLPPGCRSVALLKGGYLFASGKKEDLLVSGTLSELYGFRLNVEQRCGYYHIFREKD